MKMISDFGTTSDGQEVKKITLCKNTSGGIKVDIITYGAAVQALHVPDKDGNLADVVLGFDTVAEYEKNTPYFGVTVGRVAGRISNAEFKIDGVVYKVTDTGGGICLHGGTKGLSRRLWNIEKADDHSVALSYISPAGEEGFPGELNVSVTFSLNEKGNGLVIEYSAVVDAPCPIMLTNHSYFNLSGAGNGVVDDHFVHISASNTLTLNASLVPTGKVVSLTGTDLDLRTMTRLGDRFKKMEGPHAGFDNFYILDKADVDFVAESYEPVSNRRLRVSTDQPGIQFYTANFLDGEPGKGGKAYPEHGALCMETHFYPDGVNQPGFPNIILRPGKEYTQKTEYTFDTQA